MASISGPVGCERLEKLPPSKTPVNGLVGNSQFLNGFLDGDTNRDGVVNGPDTNSPFIIADTAFNQDVAADTFGYDLTHVGAVRGGAVTNTQFDNWTVDTGPDDSFTVQVTPANL